MSSFATAGGQVDAGDPWMSHIWRMVATVHMAVLLSAPAAAAASMAWETPEQGTQYFASRWSMSIHRRLVRR